MAAIDSGAFEFDISKSYATAVQIKTTAELGLPSE